MREVEIKIKIDDKSKVLEKLLEQGAKKIEEGMYHDVYYDGPDFSGKTLRVRTSQNKSTITYKERPEKPDEHIVDRIELQTDITQPEQMHLILKKLGFFEKQIKEKKYENYEFDGVVVELHSLPFLGDFMEIEADATKLEEVLPKLGLSVKLGLPLSYNELFKQYAKDKGLPDGVNDTYADAQKYK